MTDLLSAIGHHETLLAGRRLAAHAHRTPILTSRQANKAAHGRVFFKCETLRPSGSFGRRGTLNALIALEPAARRAGVLASLPFEHAHDVALAARTLGVSATIVLPADTPSWRRAALRDLGAETLPIEVARQELDTVSRRIAHARGLTVIPSCGHPHVIAGQATTVRELFDEVGPLDFLFLPMRQGDLVLGAAIVLDRLDSDCLLIGAEPEAGSMAHDALRGGSQDWLSTALASAAVRSRLSEVVTVTDAQLRDQSERFAHAMSLAVEPDACLAAAAMAGQRFEPGTRIGVIVGGGTGATGETPAEGRAASAVHMLDA